MSKPEMKIPLPATSHETVLWSTFAAFGAMAVCSGVSVALQWPLQFVLAFLLLAFWSAIACKLAMEASTDAHLRSMPASPTGDTFYDPRDRPDAG